MAATVESSQIPSITWDIVKHKDFASKFQSNPQTFLEELTHLLSVEILNASWTTTHKIHNDQYRNALICRVINEVSKTQLSCAPIVNFVLALKTHGVFPCTEPLSYETSPLLTRRSQASPPHRLFGKELHHALHQKNDVLALQLILHNKVEKTDYLFEAAKNHCVESLQLLLTTQQPSQEIINQLLLSACATDAVDCVKILLDAGGDPNQVDFHGFNAFHLIASNNSLNSLQTILTHLQEHPRDLALSASSPQGTPLLIAYKHLSTLFRCSLKQENPGMEEQRIAQHHLLLIETFLAAGAKFSTHASGSGSPFFQLYATESDDLFNRYVIALLVLHGIDPNIENTHRLTPLHKMVSFQKPLSFNALVLHGADITHHYPGITRPPVVEAFRELESSITHKPHEFSTIQQTFLRFDFANRFKEFSFIQGLIKPGFTYLTFLEQLRNGYMALFEENLNPLEVALLLQDPDLSAKISSATPPEKRGLWIEELHARYRGSSSSIQKFASI